MRIDLIDSVSEFIKSRAPPDRKQLGASHFPDVRYRRRPSGKRLCCKRLVAVFDAPLPMKATLRPNWTRRLPSMPVFLLVESSGTGSKRDRIWR
jgi:hypothetical protein